MPKTEEYVARIDGTCGKEEDVIVTFRYDKKDEAIRRILNKAKTRKSIARIVFELTFKNVSFRLYGSGKAIFRGLRDKEELNAILAELLS
jgi:ribonuclease HIII